MIFLVVNVDFSEFVHNLCMIIVGLMLEFGIII